MATRAQLVEQSGTRAKSASFSDFERDLAALEVAAARHSDLQHALREGAPLRRVEAPYLPLPNGRMAAPVLAVGEHARARRNEAQIRRALDALYGYSLIRHNCATELVRTLGEAFPSRAASRRALGGDIDPDGVAFLPLALHHGILDELRVERSWRIPSYRHRALESMRREQNDLLVWLREGNTLSSQIYLDNPRDGVFLLFSDGHPWLRPVLGSANLVYGTVHTALGLFTWPFDGGRRLRRGLTGALFSLPELGFVNIRKGSFDFNRDIAELLAKNPDPPQGEASVPAFAAPAAPRPHAWAAGARISARPRSGADR